MSGSWDEQQHPRAPSGGPDGGQFAAGSVSRKNFGQMSARQRMDHVKHGGTVVDSHLTDLFERIAQPDGGFTYQPFTAHEPQEGFAVSIFESRSVAISVKDLKLVDIARFVRQNAPMWRNPSHFLGVWHDPKTGKVFLDVSVVHRDERQARQLALHHDQIAYYDLKRSIRVDVNRSATSGGAT